MSTVAYLPNLKAYSKQPDPSQILQVGLGFWASKTLLSAVKLGLFDYLNDKKITAPVIGGALGIHKSYLYDWLDALASCGFLHREGKGKDAVYFNTVDTRAYLTKDSQSYIGGFLEMANDREYRFWADLEEGLQTGKPQNEIKYTGKESFAAIYEDKDRLKNFADAMGSIQVENFMALAEQYDFSPYKKVADIGGSGGLLSALLAKKHDHLQLTSFDLPDLAPIVQETIEKYGVADQVSIAKGNFWTDDFPEAEVYTMGNLLNSFSLKNKKRLIRKAYNGLPEGGALIVVEMLLDNDRIENSLGLLMSLNMLIESDGGFSYSYGQFEEWIYEAGFKRIEYMNLTGPTSAAIAYK
ncbi:methyltransferase [Roseivirga sp. BDSF3-8]|uniref:methyltransferase n=1 Tax=Roseivirga sp. BDSF3-8 TaxID=3241598 RepID=UPI003531B504